MNISLAGFEIVGSAVALGIIAGMVYGILAAGLVLIYRANRIINFAHGAIGAVGASLLGLLVVERHVPYWIAFVLALVISASVGAATEVVVVRRLRKAPSLMAMVASLGVAQFLLLMSVVANNSVGAGSTFPQPTFLPEFQIGALDVTPAYSAMLLLTPAIVAGLLLFLRKSRFGLAIRGSADNAEAAQLAGIFTGRMSTLAWAISGAIAAFTAILILPTQGFTSTDALGPALLLRALVPAVIARMASLPIALGAGIGVGIIEQVLLWNYPSGGAVEMMLFVGIVLVLLLQRTRTGRDEDKGAWKMVRPWPPLPVGSRRATVARNLSWAVGAVALIVAILLPLGLSSQSTIILVAVFGYSIVGLSVGVVTGLAGQLSLGQFALAGIGAAASYWMTKHTGDFGLGLVGAAAAGAVAAVVIGLPALRIRGLMLGVTTLSFALMAQSWLFQQDWMFAGGVNPEDPRIGSAYFDTSKRYYFFALAALVVAVLLTRNIWRSGIGRRLIAVRDNEEGARAFGISAVYVKLQAFALAGALAGFGGAVFGNSLSYISSNTFGAHASIDVVAMTVLGGIGVLVGPIVGALYVVALPSFAPLDNAGLAATALGWLALILCFPGGIAQVVQPLRERLIDVLAGIGGSRPPAEHGEEQSAAEGLDLSAHVSDAARSDAQKSLEGVGILKRYGGLVAVDNMSLRVAPSETVGLIGPNGAGKTTLFELLGGFVRADEGKVVFAGRDVTKLGPEKRARLGLVRSFQDAALFPTMTVLEVVQVSLERTKPTRFLPSLIGLSRRERRNVETARRLIRLTGLEAYENKQVAELSTGTRRIAEIACIVALEPTLLLLDEPSSGIAQRETEALAVAIARLRDAFGMSLVIIEHDIPLVMSLADRIVVMESGRLLAEGTPAEIQNNPLVIDAYLGADPLVLERSDTVKSTGSGSLVTPGRGVAGRAPADSSG